MNTKALKSTLPKIFSLLLLTALLAPSPAWSWYPRHPDRSSLAQAGPAPVIGHNEKLLVQRGDNLVQLARANGVGYRNLVRANPGIDPWLPAPGSSLVVPYANVLPTRPQLGITVNLADQRLYLTWEEEHLVRTRVYPVGIGNQGWDTPEGRFAVHEKVTAPVWTVPAALRRENPELPALIPPGPDNPLGDFWLGFSDAGHGLHGTNQPYGIGRRVSHGCIRLYPEDIRDLFRRVSTGTPVIIVYRPIKVGIRNDQLVVEVHPDYLDRIADPLGEVRRQAAALSWPWPLDRAALKGALSRKTGIPTTVSTASHLTVSDQ